ncbi:plastocyanin/azurin family copper-binding protein [Halomicrococcus sp. SG-WS-1]|uniref:plastocyanin/azurin family copper-binding protein n=1 Tax=Halomicrococcus sp. SG-WS-1 TaxID=3439057 RepID=UPI003F7B2443
MTDGETTGSVTRRGFMLGTAGAAATGAVGGVSAQEGGGESGGGGGTKTVKVVDNEFDSDEVTVAPGTTVKWVWEGNGHNIVVENQPDGSNWEGTKGGESKLYDKGHTHEHTFESTGSYEYYCAPHKAMGMTGTVTVQEGGASSSGSSKPAVPKGAKTLGVATSGALMTTLGLAYFFMKFGGDYGELGEYE